MLKYTKQKIGKLNCVQAAHPDAAEKPDAVVILCHGFGAPGYDLVPMASEFITNSTQIENVRFIFPAAPLELDPNFESRAWWQIDVEKIQQLMLTGDFREMRNTVPDRLALCNEMIVEIIEFAKSEFDLSASQVVVGGFSQGAMLTTDVALAYPKTLGGLIIWSGSLINEPVWKQTAAKHADLGVVQSHGTLDPILPFVGAEALYELLQSAGVNVNFIRFTGQHSIPAEPVAAAQQLIIDVVAKS